MNEPELRPCPNCGKPLALEELVVNGQPLTQYTCRKQVNKQIRHVWVTCFVEKETK